MQKTVETLMAKMILQDKVLKGNNVEIEVENDKLIGVVNLWK